MIKITAKTAHGAAVETHKALVELAGKYGYNTKDVVLADPLTSRNIGTGECWTILWEGGPFEWGTNLSLGTSALAGELNDYSMKAEIDLLDSPHWIAEPYWSFTLCFHDES